MLKPLDSSAALRRFFLIALLGLPLVSGCGPLVRWYNGRVAAQNPHSVTINWKASASAVEGYYVYRASPPVSPVKLTAKVIEETQYKDTTVEAGHTYSYSVTSVDFRGVESKPSELITVTVPTTVTPSEQH
jgi:fibronectin type 3 domain-containing protein